VVLQLKLQTWATWHALLLQFHNDSRHYAAVFSLAVVYGLSLFCTRKRNQKICEPQKRQKERSFMAFFNSAVGVLQTLVIALGAGLGIWGVINLLEGYGNDNPGAKSQGMKQLMAGGGVALIGATLVPLLSGLFG
jgi:hypothetical protein